MKRFRLFLGIFILIILSFLVIPVNAWYLPTIKITHQDGTSATFDTYKEAKDSILDGDKLVLYGNLIEDDIIIDKNITINVQAKGIQSNTIIINADVTFDSWDAGLVVPKEDGIDVFDISDTGSLSIVNGKFYYFKVPSEDYANVYVHKGQLLGIDYVTRNSLIIPYKSYIAKEQEIEKEGEEYPFYSLLIDYKESFIASNKTYGRISCEYENEEPIYSIPKELDVESKYILATIGSDSAYLVDNNLKAVEIACEARESSFVAYPYIKDYSYSLDIEDSYKIKNGDSYLGVKDGVVGFYTKDAQSLSILDDMSIDGIYFDEEAKVFSALEGSKVYLYKYITPKFNILESNLSFGTLMDKENYEMINSFGTKVEYGIIISSKEALDGELTVDTAQIKEKLSIMEVSYSGSTIEAIGGGLLQLSYIPKTEYNSSDVFVARIYVYIDDEYYCYMEGVEYSLRSLAQAYLDNENRNEYSYYLTLLEYLSKN